MVMTGRFWATYTPSRRTAETDFPREIAAAETEQNFVNAAGSFSAFADIRHYQQIGREGPSYRSQLYFIRSTNCSHQSVHGTGNSHVTSTIGS